MNSTFRLFAVLLLSFAAVPSAQAAINKCTTSDGRLIFSDQPCPVGQTSAVVKPSPPSATAIAPASAAAKTGVQAGVQAKSNSLNGPSDDATARVMAALSPECVAMAKKLRGLFLDDTVGITDPEIKATMTRFNAQCADSMRKATAAENARHEADQKSSILAEECDTKKRVVRQRRARPGGVSDADKPVVAAIEAEIARVCR